MVDHSLEEFNRQVLCCQDKAFTLACELLGDDEQAEKAVCQAVVQIYRNGECSPGSFLLTLLAQVIRFCRTNLRSLSLSGYPPGFLPTFQTLDGEERAAVLLVDRLELAYPEAAEVLHCSEAALASLLVRARRKLLAG